MIYLNAPSFSKILLNAYQQLKGPFYKKPTSIFCLLKLGVKCGVRQTSRWHLKKSDQRRMSVSGCVLANILKGIADTDVFRVK